MIKDEFYAILDSKFEVSKALSNTCMHTHACTWTHTAFISFKRSLVVTAHLMLSSCQVNCQAANTHISLPPISHSH